MNGIYKITNKVNNKSYIGMSTTDVVKRWGNHRTAARKEKNARYDVLLSRAIRKYGVENFTFEIIEQGLPSKRDILDREKFWVKFYDSFKNGYNMTEGGEHGTSQPNELNGRAILTIADVKTIRMMYDDKIPFRDVYERFQNVISKRGFQNVWWGKTWPNVLPHVFTEENMLFHKTSSKIINRDCVHNSKLTEAEVDKIHYDRENGFTPKQYWIEHFKDRISFSGFEKIWYKTSNK